MPRLLLAPLLATLLGAFATACSDTGGADDPSCTSDQACSRASAECGTTDNGCGGIVDCGGCPDSKICRDNRCVYADCTPTTCGAEGKNCGDIPDKCGGVLHCGSCAQGSSCGAGGVANVCGLGSCTPSTCEKQGKTCGVISDGCASTLNCGGCQSPAVCGGAGLPNVCQVPCPEGCPQGYSCDSSGACAGGAPTNLVLDVKTASVSGKVTLNGGTPTTSCTGSAGKATVRFVETTKGYVFDYSIHCSNSGFTFSETLFPGTYRVTVRGDSTSATNLPVDESGQGFVVQDALTITGALTNQVFDVKTAQVSGKVTMNGATPTTACTGSSTKVTVRFVEKTRGYVFEASIPCSNSGFTYSRTIFAGTYQVEVRGASSSATNLPVDDAGRGYVAKDSVVVSAAVSNLDLDVRTANVGGKVTLNGGSPTTNCTGSTTKARVRFEETTKGYVFDHSIFCSNAGFTVGRMLFQGTYRVTVRGESSSYTNLPVDDAGQGYVAADAFVATGTVSNQVWDVKTASLSGKVTLNGGTPTSSCTGSTTKATVRLIENTRGYQFTAPITCSNTGFTFSTTLFPGTWRALVRGESKSYTNLPSDDGGQGAIAVDAIAVNGSVANQVLDVRTFTVAGKVTLNGGAPTTGCTGSITKATVRFREPKKGYLFDYAIFCSNAGFTFSESLFPGTYTVSVRGDSTTATNLLVDDTGQGFVALDALAVTGNLTNQNLDVKTVKVSGKVTLNGGTPTTSCTGSIGKATVRFFEPGRGYVFDYAVFCSNAGFTFTETLYPGNWRVSVRGESSSYTNLPVDDVSTGEIVLSQIRF